jgi:methylated-DNA-[protein]-cysteine S-methyltransferase
MTALGWARLDTPVGEVSVGCSATGVARVRFGASPGAANDGAANPGAANDGAANPGAANPGAGDELAREAGRQLADYFCGRRRDFDLPLDWSATSGTQRHVLQVLAGTVGYGQTTSYGALAERSGLTASGNVPPGTAAVLPTPARAVGKIMGSNPIPVIVPCHRVLASDGLGGYSGGTGLEVKRWLLILEGSLPPTLDWEPAPPPG